ncbi:MAG: hypothetical protein ACJAYJ_003104 [Saprospiraceae bacterium]
MSRLVRKSLSFSKIDKWHNLAIGWFFWQFNLERQHYISYTATFSTNKNEFERGKLASGLYIFRMETLGRLLVSVKIVFK